jgi:hypothetical protein
MDSDFDYHMDRSATELEFADKAPGRAAEAHRKLAELHHARAETHRFIERLATGTVREGSIPIFRTDKEA